MVLKESESEIQGWIFITPYVFYVD